MKKVKSFVFNLMFKKEIEELWKLRQEFALKRQPMQEARIGIDIALRKFGATNTAYKYLTESERV